MARQDTVTAGRVTTCQAGVLWHLASDGAFTAVKWRLFLPGSWDPASPKADPAQAARRDTCAVPARVGHAEKRQPAPGMIDKTRSGGIEVPRVIADGGYGDTAAFRLGPEERGLGHVVGISTTTTHSPGNAQPSTPACSGRGPHPAPARPGPAQQMKSLLITAGTSSARPVCGGGRERGRAARTAAGPRMAPPLRGRNPGHGTALPAGPPHRRRAVRTAARCPPRCPARGGHRAGTGRAALPENKQTPREHRRT
ncbi:transposase [Streptomyces rubiginosohelvolus]|uniref:transposase n=1 Tax=Streptomyces rubiginosohelvolus TaxID=67362 RepID=UPI0036D92F7B